ncbi:MAG: cytochrome c biogenesis protein CcsA [Pirellulales bacterium]|nr:cytochrome c biogenesis protein CcsA [Pirellulales bacterium]
MPSEAKHPPARRTPARVARGALRAMASAGMATVVIAAGAVVLAWATLWLDNRYGLEAATFAVYHAWWFAALGFLLGVNVLAAALVRFPWKRKHVGFLLVHAGILVLLIGCWLTARDGVDAELRLFEGERGSTAVSSEQEFLLTISPLPPAGEGPGVRGVGDVAQPPSAVQDSSTQPRAAVPHASFAIPFRPGPFNWDDYAWRSWLPWRLARRDTGVVFDRDGVTLEVLDYCSRSRLVAAPNLSLRVARNRQADRRDPAAWLPVDLSVRAVIHPRLGDRKLYLGTRETLNDGLSVVFRAASGPAETAAFLDSRPEGNLGRLGQVVLHAGGKKHVLRVDDLRGKPTPLGDSGLAVELGAFDPEHLIVQLLVRDTKEKDDRPGMVMLGATRTDFDLPDPRHGVFGSYYFDASIAPEKAAADDIPAEMLREAAQPRLDVLQGHDEKLYYRAWRSPAVAALGELPSDGREVVAPGTVPISSPEEMGLSPSMQAPSTQDPNPDAKVALPLAFYVEQFTPSAVPGVRVEPLPFKKEGPRQPRARVRLSVDGQSREFWLPNRAIAGEGEESLGRVTSGSRAVEVALGYREIPLGFDVRLLEFIEKLDPGTSRPSYYASRVDIIPKPVGDAEPAPPENDVLVELNEPCPVVDPATGRTYRLFQTSFRGPFGPGDDEFSQFVAGRRKADTLFQSIFTVAFDPGRSWKYAGCLMIIAGIAVMYYMKAYMFARRRAPVPSVGQAPPDNLPRALLLAALLLPATACAAAEPAPLDWSRWEALPAFGGGRIMPLDTFARRAARDITGREKPTLLAPDPSAGPAAAALFPDGQPRKFSSSELLFSWLVEPEAWEDVAFLPAKNESLRQDLLNLPLRGSDGRRLAHVSPRQLEESTRFFARLAELNRRQRTAGAADEELSLSAADEAVAALNTALRSYRVLTFDPDRPAVFRQAFFPQLDQVVPLWRRELAPRLSAWRGQDDQGDLAGAVRRADEAVEQLMGLLHGESFTLAQAEPPVVALRKAAAKLAAYFADKRDRAFDAMNDDAPMLRSARAMVNAMAAQTARLARTAAALEVALYENGHPMQPGERTPRLVPALDRFALESSRDPGAPAPPWLSWPRLLLASDAALAGYPIQDVAAVRAAFAEAKSAYLDREAADRPERFARAMDRFADAVRALGEAVEPLREKLPLVNRDAKLLADTAYPPEGFGGTELRYNRLDPFRWAWVLSVVALGVLALGVGRAKTFAFVVGAAILAAGQAVAVHGLWLRAEITRMVPVANMYETVLFTGMTVAVLGLWFALVPLAWPGLAPAWRLTAIPWRRRGEPADDDSEAPALPAWSPWRMTILVLRAALVAGVFYLLAIAPLGPQGRPVLALDVRLGSLTPALALGLAALGLVGVAMVGWTLWFVPRAILAAAMAVVLVPWELRRQGVAAAMAEARGRRGFLMAGAAVALLAYLVAYFAPGEVFQRDVGTGMTAVLRNNFWLAIHVLVITASYGAGALAWGLANGALACYAFGRYRQPSDVQAPDAARAPGRPPEVCARLAGSIYRATQVAVLLLAAGTITGAIWADFAWGRYWGWDPKEIGALVTLLVYLVVLHGRWAGWMGPFALAVGAVAGATAILVTWYGVNFVFTGGLHSYGQGSGGAFIVGLCLVLNWLFVAVASIRYAAEIR